MAVMEVIVYFDFKKVAQNCMYLVTIASLEVTVMTLSNSETVISCEAPIICCHWN